MSFLHSRHPVLALLCASFASWFASIDDATLPQKEKEIPLSGEGSWDYATVDVSTGRLYVAHSTQIDVIDTTAGKRVGQVEGLSGAHGTAIVPDVKRGFSTSGGNDKLMVFDLESLKVTSQVDTGAGPDAVLFVSSIGEVWAMCHKGGVITCVDAKTLEVKRTIDIGGTLEFAVEDPAKGQVFVNVEDKNVVAVIDAEKHEVTRRLAVAPGEGPAGLAIDRKSGLLFVGCGNQKLVVVDVAAGTVVSTLDIGEHCDGVAFDAGLGNLFASCRGASNAFHEKDAKTFQPLGTLEAGKTCAVDPKSHRLYITSGTRGEKDSVKVYVFAAKHG